MSKLGRIGLGRMGLAMSSRLLQAGHDLHVWNRTIEKGLPLVAKGARITRNVRDLAACDIVFICSFCQIIYFCLRMYGERDAGTQRLLSTKAVYNL